MEEVRQGSLPASDLYGVIAEMRTPLLELKLLAEAGKLAASREVASRSLDLFDSLLYAQKLQQSPGSLSLKPRPLLAATEAVLRRVTPLARLYQVRLDFQPAKLAKRINVSVAEPAFEHATRSLLHGLISSLQNQPHARLRVQVSRSKLPTLWFFSNEMQVGPPAGGLRAPRLKLNPDASGLGSGLLLASWIYRRMGSRLQWIANQHGQGLAVSFQRARRPILTKALAR